MEHLTVATKQEIIARQKKTYARATRKGKSMILDSLVLTTQLSRDHIIRVLNGNYAYRSKPVVSGRGRKPTYTMEHKKLLLYVWELLNYPCSKRLKGALADVLENLIRFGHIAPKPDLLAAMKQISPSTIDRLLAHNRKQLNPFGHSTTKPGSMLKSQIPVRRGSDWDDAMIGFVEIDLVAHCGSNTRGEYVNTLDVTDVCSGWTECRAVRNKARVHTIRAMESIEQSLPFPLLGIDSDNGGEFINDHFFHWTKDRNLVFTRSRPNQKNDSCYVEQKNWSVVRQAVGYTRFEGQKAVDLLNEFYHLLRLVNNFFTPSQKLLERKRIGAQVLKKHDAALTPYRRLLLNPDLDSVAKKALVQEFESIDLLVVRKTMDEILAKIQKLGLGY